MGRRREFFRWKRSHGIKSQETQQRYVMFYKWILCLKTESRESFSVKGIAAI